jgi:hypothetical protein
MPSLYDEAIADAKELVRMAEENATNRLIESVAPRIRKIVEKKLTESSMYEDDDIDSIVASLDKSDDDDDDQIDDDQVEDIDSSEPDFSFDDEGESFEDEDDVDMDSFSSSGSMASFPMKGVKKINIEFEGDRVLTDEGVELSNESINTLLGIIDGKSGLNDRIREARMELKLLGRALGALNEGRTSRKTALQIVENFNNILRKSLGFQGEINTLPKGKLKESSSSEMSLLLKEIKIMSTKSLLRTLLEREEAKNRSVKSRRNLREADEDEDEDEGEDEAESSNDDEVDDEGSDDGGGVDVNAVKSAIESLAAAVGMEVKNDDSGSDDEDMDIDMDMDSDDSGDEDMGEGSVYEMDMEMDEMDMEMDEMGMDEEMHESRKRVTSRRKADNVFVVNESQLRKELHRLRARRLREEIEPGDSFGGEPEEEFSSYDDVELNANVSEADKAGKAKAEKKAAEAEKKAVEESRKNRVLSNRLSEASAAIQKLRKELNEQKLFNAKLLYVNKLMQNPSLPMSKLKTVVEALDSAKTLREANLLYNSLNESLTRSTNKLAEGANRTVGRSSRSTRSSGLVNESVGETDRWAILAGIGTKA